MERIMVERGAEMTVGPNIICQYGGCRNTLQRVQGINQKLGAKPMIRERREKGGQVMSEEATRQRESCSAEHGLSQQWPSRVAS